MMTECKLTTNDNPYDPFTQFDDWFLYDVEKGYDSCSRLMRIANIEDSFSELENNIEIERAIDQILKYDFTDTYKKVSREYNDVQDSDIV